jgi:glyoxylase-like metal-dependent hydrolase (beta-lactamase superfamily II)
MNRLAPGIFYVDLGFLATPHVIATAVLHGRSGVALIDPGPSSTLHTLSERLEEAGIGIADITAVLLTHIHLDHAGATGTLIRRNPRIRVYVHERGVPHITNPDKLLASATRLYGHDMDRLWSEFLPVPPTAIVALAGGEQVEVAGHALEVAYTPGHAAHHLSYFNGATGLAFVGDTAGVRREGPFVLTPTLPPDIDLELWRDSLVRIAAWRPARLFLTHFGPWSSVDSHLAALRENMELTSRWARESLQREGSDESREAWFVGRVEHELRRTAADADVRAYQLAGRFDLCWRGLARYWRTATAVSR